MLIKDGNSPVLQLDKVGKSFGGLQVLVDLDISVWHDEMLGIIGPNGAGKTTVFNVITSLYRLDKGRIYFQGKDITNMSPHKICHLGIARTYQLVKVFLKMTVMENIMVASFYGRSSHDKVASARNRAMEALEFLELSQLRDTKVANLTLSYRRRLEIAMALVSMPVLALLDEPMAGLTPEEIEKLVELVIRIRKETKVSIMWIEHRVDAIFDYCDRVIALDRGRKIADGQPDKVANDSKVIEVYLGEPIT